MSTPVDCTLVGARRLPNSADGNPRYRLAVVLSGSGVPAELETDKNSQVGHTAFGSMIGTAMTLHCNRRGSVIGVTAARP